MKSLTIILRLCTIAIFACVIIGIAFVKPKFGNVGLIRSKATRSLNCSRDVFNDLVKYFNTHGCYPDSLSQMYEGHNTGEYLNNYIRRTAYLVSCDGRKYLLSNNESLHMDQVVLKNKSLSIMLTLINMFMLSLAVNLELIRSSSGSSKKPSEIFSNPIIVISSFMFLFIILQELIVYANQ